MKLVDERFETIHGVTYDIGQQSAVHEILVNELHDRIWDYVKRKKSPCRVFKFGRALYIENSRDYILPDVIVMCDKSRCPNRTCVGAPDMVVEVVSKSSKLRDYNIKSNLYTSSGVREYWIVDVVDEEVFVIQDGDIANYSVYDFDSKIPVGIFEDLMIDFREIKEVISEE